MDRSKNGANERMDGLIDGRTNKMKRRNGKLGN